MQNGGKQDLDDLHPTEHHWQVLREHAREISIHSRLSRPKSCASHIHLKRDADHLRAFIHFTWHSFCNYVLAVLISPQTILIDPFGTIFAFIVLPLVHIGLTFVQLAFLLGECVGAGGILKWLRIEYGSGLSVVNMLEPNIFDDRIAKPIHAAARKGFVNPYGYPIKSWKPDPNEDIVPARYFNLDIAQSLIILCALVYERDDQRVVEAGKIAEQEHVSECERQRQVAICLQQSTEYISRQAANWGFNFSSVSDLISIGGPFCSLFWPKDLSEKWIVVAFKGTSPTNFSEFMVDATIAHQNASGFFGSGALHRGFYTSLVPGTHSEVNPYASILRSLKSVAKSMRHDGEDGKVNLWITGHSLGAALAALLYARLMFSPQDLGEDLVLRQAYVYGMPRVANAEFVSAFDYAASTPYGDTTKSLWRIIDRSDIVTSVPSGLADHEETRAALPPSSLLNYGHFGTAGFKLTGVGQGWKLQRGSLKGGSKMHVVQSKTSAPVPLPQRPVASKTMDVLGFKIDPIEILSWAASWVPPLNDHMPYSYYSRLQQVKPEFVA